MTNIHILDLLMYFPCALLLWKLIAIISDNQATEELGALVGLFIEGVFMLLYIAVFFFSDYNWIDLFRGCQHFFSINISL